MAKKRRNGAGNGTTDSPPSLAETAKTNNSSATQSQKSVHWKDQEQTPTTGAEKEQSATDDNFHQTPSTASSKTYVSIALFSFMCGILLPVVRQRWTSGSAEIFRNEMPSGLDKLKTILNEKKFHVGPTENTSVRTDDDSGRAERRLHENVSPGESGDCTDESLSQFLHDWPTAGIHVACVSKSDDDKLRSLHVKLFRGAFDYESPVEEVKPHDDGEVDWEQLRELLEDKLDLPESGPRQQPWAVFTPDGARIVGADDGDDDIHDEPDEVVVIHSILHSNMIIVIEGGAWVWPGVRLGFVRRNVNLYSVMPGPPGTSHGGNKNKTVDIETLSLKPLVLSVQNFIADNECDVIQEVAEPSMEYSEVTKMDHDKGKPSSDWRTSQSTFVKGSRSKVLRDLELRTASLTRIPLDHQEDVQVLRYGATEHYSAHHDYFDPRMYKSDRGTLSLIQGGRRNRLATVFWYLSDVEEGGETVFPRWNGAPQPVDFKDCSKGLKVKPERGKVIIFYSLNARGQQDELSLHGACAVKKGIKWAANKWVWNAPMHFIDSEY